MRRRIGEQIWAFAVWALVVFFVVNLLAMIGSVLVNSFGTRWFNTWLPAGYTPQWYSLASAIAMLMAAVQVVIIAALLGARTLLFRGPVSTGKG